MTTLCVHVFKIICLKHANAAAHWSDSQVPARLNPDWCRFLTGCLVGEVRAEADGVPPRDMEYSDTGPSYIPLGTAFNTASCRNNKEGERSQRLRNTVWCCGWRESFKIKCKTDVTVKKRSWSLVIKKNQISCLRLETVSETILFSCFCMHSHVQCESAFVPAGNSAPLRHFWMKNAKQAATKINSRVTSAQFPHQQPAEWLKF